jgi:hypothetical protein
MANWKELSTRIPHVVHTGKKERYEIVWVEDFADGQTYGETRFDPLQIALKKGLSEKETVLTYLHEVLHAASHTHEIGLTETQVRKLEKALIPLLKEGNLFTPKKRKKK